MRSQLQNTSKNQCDDEHFIAQPNDCGYNAIIRLRKVVIIMKRDIFQAIADPTRRAIMVLIAANAMTPNALAGHFDISRQATSKHIRILDECGLLEQMKSGREIHYQLKLEKINEIDIWLNQFRQLWEARYNNLDNLLTQLNGNDNESETSI